MPVAVPQKASKKPESKAVPQAASASGESEALEPFGAQIPFADPSWYQSVSDSPTLGKKTRLLRAGK